MEGAQAAASSRRYFVDEAGDATLFDRGGRTFVGQPGCSSYFILGFLDVEDAAGLDGRMQSLRASLLADPYLLRVASMEPASGKTALRFHATDDVPEVRKQVFEVARSVGPRYR